MFFFYLGLLVLVFLLGAGFVILLDRMRSWS